MSPETLAQLERVAALGIQLLPAHGLPAHFVFERDGFVVLVERRGGGFGALGSPGLLIEKGFAALVEHEGRPCFVHKNDRRVARPGQAEAARQLFTDLKSALR